MFEQIFRIFTNKNRYTDLKIQKDRLFLVKSLLILLLLSISIFINYGFCVVPHVDAVKQIAVGARHSCVLTTDNKVYCYGYNGHGNIGIGSGGSWAYSTPQEVTTLSDVRQIDAGSDTTCAINTSGELYCWGSNYYGQVGIDASGSTTSRVYAPTLVSRISNVTQVSVGDIHACAVTKDAEAYCWGYNQMGRLGIGNTTAKTSPTKVLLDNVAYIAAGQFNTCAITIDKYLYCWGYNGYGQLGNGETSTNNTKPVRIDAENVEQVAVGSSHICYVNTSGNAYCSGYNTRGQLGNGTTTNSTTFVQVSLSNIADLRAANGTTLFLTNNGDVYFTGYNNYGLGGNGIASSNVIKTPTKVNSLNNIRQIDIDYYENNLARSYACVVNNVGKVYCWGSHFWGALGDEQLGLNSSLYNVNTLNNVKVIATGTNETCAIDSNDDLYCFGYNLLGQLGDGTNVSKSTPTYVASNVQDVSIGSSFVCMIRRITEGGNQKDILYCFGEKAHFGAGTDINTPSRAKIGNTSTNFTTVKKISTGSLHVCAITTDDELYCYGANGSGQIGNNSTSRAYYMTKVSSLSNVVDVKCGTDSTCALTSSGELYCWGKNEQGQIGDGTKVNKKVPTLVQGIGTVTQFDTRGNITCALNTSNQLYCWGNNANGIVDGNSLGDNDYKTSPVLNTVFSSKVSSVAKLRLGISEHMLCLLSTTGELYCTGSSNLGVFQIFNSYTTATRLGAAIGTIELFDTSGSHMCAKNTTGDLYCWGNDLVGQLGDGIDYVMSPKEIYDGTGDAPCNSSPCCDHAYKSTIEDKDICDNGLSNACYASGEYACYGSYGRASVVCNALAPYCCQSEDYGAIGTECSTGVGECRRNGVFFCDGIYNDSEVSCNAVPGTATSELCNGLDDDCDTETDEDFAFTNYDSSVSNIGEECTKKTGEIEYMGNVYDIVGKGTLVCQGTSSSTCQIYDSDNDGVPDNQDVCPGINDNATFTYNGSHLQYVGKTYRNIDDMDQDGFINCIDECVDDLPEDDPSFGLDSISDIKIRGAGCEPTPIGGFDGNQGTFTPTLTNTFTNTSTETNTQTSTPINTNTNTLTETYTDTPTNAPTLTNTYTNTTIFTYTNTFTLENTNTATNTYTNTVTHTSTPTFTNTYTDTNVQTNTYTNTPTFTNMFTDTNEITQTFTPITTATNTPNTIDVIDVITPKTDLENPKVQKDTDSDLLYIQLPEIHKASINESVSDANAKYRYVIHIRKLKRLGIKDKFYKLGKKFLTYRRKNILKFKNLDRGIYSVRYQVIITLGNKTRMTKWSKRTLVEI